ncbi:MAG: DNA replication/repair protein RecF, partial [Bdellovibrionales bacterium]|nr:DNA replication/repair protein RecF [Bdellovibrionales bacterium]
MFLSELRLYHYRNLADNTLNLCPGINFVVGQNGQGKTNLLEAIHLLSTTRSFRTIKYQELIGWDQEEASVFGRIERTDFNLELGLSLEKKKRRVFVNGEEAKSYAHYLENFVSVSFTPSDLEIVQGGPPARRRFLDRYMCFVFPSVFEKLVSYQRALKNKNAHLKQKSVTVAQVQAWNEILIPLSYEISQVRKQFLSLIETKAARALSELAPQDGTLQLSLESNISEGEGRSEDEVRRKYEELIPREIASQRTLIGIHRDDVGIVVGNRKARSFASQGQTRSIVLALVLGVMELLEEKIGEPPVVLLDDVESELDDRRTQNLFQLAFSRGCQVFVSGTHYEHVKEWCKSDGQQIITVSNGKITTAD